MIAAFKTHWPKDMGEWAGKPTYFPEKIWQSFPDEITTDVFTEYSDGFEQVDYNFHEDAVLMPPKKHTLRQDKFDRWGPGANIHFAINNRRPDYFQFAPVVKCVSVQQIAVLWTPQVSIKGFEDRAISIDGNNVWIIVDGGILKSMEIEQLALNDGFESVEQFFAWFNTDFTGKIIHWTDLKY